MELQGGGLPMLSEQVLKSGRDAALALLRENRGQVRDGVERLVQERLPAILQAARAPGAGAEDPVLYAEVLTLAYNLFALGYTIRRTETDRG